jgi:lipoate-protein ligase A
MQSCEADPPLAVLELLEDCTPRTACLQMALDEALLASITTPLLRVYRWKDPCLTLGYFERFGPVSAAFPSHEITRRWTGGGTVSHGSDWPYSLLVPASHPFARKAARESYFVIHSALARCLASINPPIHLASSDRTKTSSDCFENPVQHDLLQQGQKIAGAGQRRTQSGLLHQGSVQLDASQHPSAQTLASHLAAGVRPFAIRNETLHQAEQICRARYGNAAWITKF